VLEIEELPRWADDVVHSRPADLTLAVRLAAALDEAGHDRTFIDLTRIAQRTIGTRTKSSESLARAVVLLTSWWDAYDSAAYARARQVATDARADLLLANAPTVEADIRLRMAMSKAIDRQVLIDETLQGAGTWNGIVPVGFGKWALSVDEVKQVNAYKFDVAEAKKLWDAAGAPKRAIEFYYSSNGTTGGIQAQYYQRAWKQNLGIDLTIKTEDYSIFLPKSYNGKYPDMDSLGYVLPDWTENLFAPYLKGGTRNGSNIDDPKVTAMLQDIRQTLDDNAAVEKSKAAQHYLQDQSLTLTQVPIATGMIAWNSKLRDFVPGVFPPGFEWMRGMWKTK